MKYLFALLSLVFAMTAARADVVPQAPDYADSTQWYASPRGAEVDVFYIVSTETGDYRTPSGEICHHADTYADSTRRPLLGEMLGVDTLLSGTLNYYSPYYRQCSLQTFASDSTARVHFPVALADVKRAFSHYLEHQNQGRPFILAGFSQGARLALQLLLGMPDSAYQRMVAAYIIGLSISPEEAANPHVRPAQGPDDIGVTISYNSVRDAQGEPFGKLSALSINPVNWRTDAQPATLITEPTPWLPVDQQKPDTMTVHRDPATGLIEVQGYTATDYVLPLRGNPNSYHTREIWLYRHQLRRNMAQRAAAFLKQKARYVGQN